MVVEIRYFHSIYVAFEGARSLFHHVVGFPFLVILLPHKNVAEQAKDKCVRGCSSIRSYDLDPFQ